MSFIKRKNISLGMVVLTIVLMLTIAGWFMLIPPPLIIQGQVEATEMKVASKIVGRVKTIYVKEGQKVQPGQMLLSLDSPEIEAKYRQAKAGQKAARAQRTKAYSGTRKEQVQSAKNVWQKAEAAFDLTKKTYARIKKLHSEGVIPAQKLDEAEAQMKVSEMTRNAARATYNMALAGARDEDKQSAIALMDQASGAVAEVQAYLKETSLSAPISSEVVNIVSKLGELVSPGYPLITLVDLSDTWVTFNLREDMLSDVKMGYFLDAEFPALKNKKVRLKINYISAQGDFATWKATRTSGDFDMRTFEVRAVAVEKIKGLSIS